ncbi:hypothetical protein LEP1GSC188_5197 [Leptospira weilii serovar Topaz str. LT2116]|uniref:Uncharacterized protein n=1 Tax=Leptospira weilii serovar Topaz str. LT2116 TaxID=1088540 RepID=M3G395_9LEPT|nr:hypothetical protein LEP1GSC188_5197 [Leptospira weilii serovar Topaz str. LT2116]
MSLDPNSLPDDVEKLKRIIIFQNIKLTDQNKRKLNIRKKSASKS